MDEEQLQEEKPAAEDLPEEEKYILIEQEIEAGELDCAQKLLDSIKIRGGKWHYLQSKICNKRRWYNEQRKQLKTAIKAEPDNEKYKKELKDLEIFRKSSVYKEIKKSSAYKQGLKEQRKQMGIRASVSDDFCECAGEVCCTVGCSAICESLDGC